MLVLAYYKEPVFRCSDDDWIEPPHSFTLGATIVVYSHVGSPSPLPTIGMPTASVEHSALAVYCRLATLRGEEVAILYGSGESI